MLADMDDLQMFSWLLIIQFVYGLITLILYTLTVVILVMNWKHFDIYFFKLYVYQYFFNMWMYCNYYITSRIPSATCADCTFSSWFSSLSQNSTSNFPVHIFFFLHYHMAFINYTNVLLTSFNRWTMIFMNKHYAKIWHYGNFLMIALFLVVPFVFTFPLLSHNAYFDYNPSSDTYVARTSADLSQVYSVLLVWMALATALNIVINVACWYKISKYSQIARQKSDYRLFLVSFVTFLIQAIVFGLGILNKISADVDPTKVLITSRIGQVLSPFGNDLLTLSPPIVLVVFSKRIRKTVRLLFSKRTFTSLSITPVQNLRISKTAASKIPNP